MPRALVPFIVIANVACSYCLLHIISTWIGPYRLAQKVQMLQEGHFTPYNHVSSHYANKCTPNPSKCWPVGWFRRETDRETDQEIFGYDFVFCFFRFLFYKKLKNVSCEYYHVNGWNSTLQAAWYMRYLHRLSFARVLCFILMKDIGRWLPWMLPGSTGRFFITILCTDTI